MTKRWARAALIIALLMTLPEPAASAKCGGGKGERLTVTGTVVAYEQSALRLAKLTFVPRTERLIVRVDKRIKGREDSRYIKVVYTFGTDEPSLPDAIYAGGNRWRFTLTRDRSCDGAVQDPTSNTDAKAGAQIPQLQRTPGAEAEAIPTDSSLPCYALRPRDFRSAEGRK